jgi:hypothetical protein
MDAFGFRFVWITSEGKSLRPANAHGKHLQWRPAPAAVISSNRIAASRLTSNRRQRSQWLEAQSSVSVVEPVRAPSPPPQQTGSAAPDFVATAASAEALPKPSRAERIELAIDSLQNYELIKPIPVLIESLGDTVFVAEARFEHFDNREQCRRRLSFI